MPEEHKNDPLVRNAARVIIAGGISVVALIVVAGWAFVGKFISYRMELKRCDDVWKETKSLEKFDACHEELRRNF